MLDLKNITDKSAFWEIVYLTIYPNLSLVKNSRMFSENKEVVEVFSTSLKM